MILLYFKISKINLGEARRVCAKLDWCRKAILLHYKTKKWEFGKIKGFAAKFTKKSRTT